MTRTSKTVKTKIKVEFNSCCIPAEAEPMSDTTNSVSVWILRSHSAEVKECYKKNKSFQNTQQSSMSRQHA